MSFNIRLSIIYFTLIIFVRAFPIVGPMLCRVYITLTKTMGYYLVILISLCSFALSFNLMHHRRMSDTTFDSFYGSFLQTMLFFAGGVDSSFGDDSDSAIFMSLFLVLFVFVVILMVLVLLISVLSEAYNCSDFEGISNWREEQMKLVVLRDSIMTSDQSKHPFYNPKWLQILVPVSSSASMRGIDLQDQDSAVNRMSKRKPGCSCEGRGDGSSKLSAEIQELRGLVEELMDSSAIAATAAPQQAQAITSPRNEIHFDEDRMAQLIASRVEDSLLLALRDLQPKVESKKMTSKATDTSAAQPVKIATLPEKTKVAEVQPVQQLAKPETIIIKPVKASLKQMSRITSNDVG